MDNSFRTSFTEGICLHPRCSQRRLGLSCLNHSPDKIKEYIIKDVQKISKLIEEYELFFTTIGEKAINGFTEIELEKPEIEWFNPYDFYIDGSISFDEIESFDIGSFRISLNTNNALFKWKDYIMFIDPSGKKIFMNDIIKLNKMKSILEIDELTDTILNKKFRKMSLKHHPDRKGGNSNKFNDINIAKEYLKQHLDGNVKSMGWFVPSYYSQISSLSDPDIVILQNLFEKLRDLKFYEKILYDH